MNSEEFVDDSGVDMSARVEKNCRNGSKCSSNFQCYNGSCKRRYNACSNDNHCNNGEMCYNKMCMLRHKRCYSDSACGLDQACIIYSKSRGRVYKRCFYRDYGEEGPKEEVPKEVSNKCTVKTEKDTNGRCGQIFQNAYCNVERWCSFAGVCTVLRNSATNL